MSCSVRTLLRPNFNQLRFIITLKWKKDGNFADFGLVSFYRGKGTPRRKTKRVHKSSGADDKKLQTTLKKMNVQPIQAIEEVNMFKEDGNVIHFSAPKGESKSYSLLGGLLYTPGFAHAEFPPFQARTDC